MTGVHRKQALPLRERVGRWVEAEQARPPAPVAAWAGVFALGLATLLMAAHLATVFPASGYAVPPGFGAPVLAFEFARDMRDLAAIFGPEGDPLRDVRLAMMQSGNELDYLFLLIYAAFLSLGCWCLWRETRRPLVLLGAVMPWLAAAFDAVENWLLFGIQAAFVVGEYSPDLAGLWLPVTTKFLLLGATNLVIGLALGQLGSRALALVGALTVAPLVALVMALIAPMAFGWTLVAAIGGGWLALTGVAAAATWKLAARRAPLVNFDAVQAVQLRPRPARATPAADGPDDAADTALPATPATPRTFGRAASRRAPDEHEDPR